MTAYWKLRERLAVWKQQGNVPRWKKLFQSFQRAVSSHSYICYPPLPPFYFVIIVNPSLPECSASRRCVLSLFAHFALSCKFLLTWVNIFFPIFVFNGINVYYCDKEIRPPLQSQTITCLTRWPKGTVLSEAQSANCTFLAPKIAKKADLCCFSFTRLRKITSDLLIGK